MKKALACILAWIVAICFSSALAEDQPWPLRNFDGDYFIDTNNVLWRIDDHAIHKTSCNHARAIGYQMAYNDYADLRFKPVIDPVIVILTDGRILQYFHDDTSSLIATIDGARHAYDRGDELYIVTDDGELFVIKDGVITKKDLGIPVSFYAGYYVMFADGSLLDLYDMTRYLPDNDAQKVVAFRVSTSGWVMFQTKSGQVLAWHDWPTEERDSSASVFPILSNPDGIKIFDFWGVTYKFINIYGEIVDEYGKKSFPDITDAVYVTGDLILTARGKLYKIDRQLASLTQEFPSVVGETATLLEGNYRVDPSEYIRYYQFKIDLTTYGGPMNRLLHVGQ